MNSLDILIFIYVYICICIYLQIHILRIYTYIRVCVYILFFFFSFLLKMLKDHERPRNNEHPWSPDCGPKILPTQTDKQKQGFYEDS